MKIMFVFTQIGGDLQVCALQLQALCYLSIYLSIGINVRFAAMMADVGDGLL